MKRHEMLSRIRSALDKNDPSQADVAVQEKRMREKMDLASDLSHPRTYPSTENLIMRFVVGAKKNGIELIEVEEKKHIPLKLKTYLSEISTHSPILCFEKEILDLPWTSQGLKVDNGTLSLENKIGMSLAWGAIAETGTLMLLSSPSNPTSLSFLSEVHIIFLKISKIFNTLEDAFAHLLTIHKKKRLPHAINLISGASRTGDIGGHIVLGAHGPIQLAVVLIKEE